MSERLKSSWELKNELKNMSIPNNLREQIDLFIANNDKKNTGTPHNYSNLVYRGNLHYIIDHISKVELIDELSEYNEKALSCPK